SFMRDGQLERDPRLSDDAVPAPDTGYGILDVIVAKLFIEGVERRRFAHLEAPVNDLQYGIEGVPQKVVVGERRFSVAPLEAARIERCGVRGYVGAEQIDGYAEMKIKIPLDGRQ